MQNFNFKHWLEAIDNPEAIAQHWHNNLPNDQDFRNPKEISHFVDLMSDPIMNGQAIALDLHKAIIHQSRYDKPIVNNLLNIKNIRLKYAHGLVSNRKNPEFSFYMQGKNAGQLVIQHPPLVYDNEDKVLLTSIIEHELGHAQDWLNPKYENIPPSGNFTWNMQKYAENLHEARRLSDQLRSLLIKLNNKEAVLKVLRGQRFTPDKMINKDSNQLKHMELNPVSPFALNKELLPVAQAFLNIYKKEDFNPPAIVQNYNKEFAQEAANCIVKILNMFHLRYFIVR